MKNFARILAMLMAVSITFVGCGQGTPKGTSSADSSAPSQAPVSDYGDTGGLQLPLTDKEVTLTWVAPSDVVGLNDKAWAKEILKRTGIKLDIQAYPTASFNEKMKVILGSGTLPDIMTPGIDLSQINTYGSQGAFATVNDHIDNMPNFKALFFDNKDNNWMKFAYSDEKGNIYILPIYGLNRDVNFGFMYRADTFKELNIEPWKNTEEFYQAMKKIKEAYPKSFPFASKSGVRFFNRMAGNWGMEETEFYFDEADSNWKYVATDAKYKEMLDFWKKSYNEGLLDPEFLTDTQDSWSAKMTTDKAFIINDWIGRLELFPAQVKETDPDYDLRFGLPVGYGKQAPLAKFSSWGVVVANNKNSELSMKLVDYMYSPSGSELFTIGIEGETFEFDAAGKPVYPELKDEKMIDINLLQEKYGLWVEGMYVRPDHRSIYYNFSEREQEAQDLIMKNNLLNPQDPEVKFSDDENKKIAAINTELQKEKEIFSSKYITDKSYGDKEWNEWVKKAESIKSNEVVNIYNEAQKRFNEYVKTK